MNETDTVCYYNTGQILYVTILLDRYCMLLLIITRQILYVTILLLDR